MREEYGHAGSVEKEEAKWRELSIKFLSKLGIQSPSRRINTILLIHNILDSLYRRRIVTRNDENGLQNGEEGSTG
ncbi:MAG: hypothetical protein GXO43_07945 [Crenarchaeota archaeon]|nr:hypothetical protein [Thermoproteota archaeon]